MKNSLLTARGLYTLLNSGADGVSRASFLSKHVRYTLTHYWGNFLREIVPDTVVDPYFQTGENRSRALSSLMNRSCIHSAPVKLLQALEECLTEDNLVYLTIWTTASLDQATNPMILHDALNAYENRLSQSDMWLERAMPFFERIRPVYSAKGNYHLKKMFLLAGFRVTMLGLHALYGDRMLESKALIRLKSSHLCDIEVLWMQATSVSPRLNGPDMSMVSAAQRHAEANKPDLQRPGDISALADRLSSLLPPAELWNEADPATCGWYAVANWQDVQISVNDSPRPTYDGAAELARINNGTLLYILSAPGYKGLHVSHGVWGKTFWDGRIAWVPMNLMVRISTGKSGDAITPDSHK